MNKNKAVIKIGSSIAAAMVSYIVIEIVTKDMASLWKLLIVITVCGIALAVAFWAGKTDPQDSQSTETNVASEVIAKGAIELNGIEVDATHAGNLDVVSKISAGKDVKISNVSVNKN